MTGSGSGPLGSSLGRAQPRQPAAPAELEALRRAAWRTQGALLLRLDDARLSWDERELLRRLGARLYGERGTR